MSAMGRSIRRRCPQCKAQVIYRYDADGASQSFEAKGDGVVPHVCSVPRDLHVGGRVPATKTPTPEVK